MLLWLCGTETPGMGRVHKVQPHLLFSLSKLKFPKKSTPTLQPGSKSRGAALGIKSLPEAISSPSRPAQAECSNGKFALPKNCHKILGSGCCAGTGPGALRRGSASVGGCWGEGWPCPGRNGTGCWVCRMLGVWDLVAEQGPARLHDQVGRWERRRQVVGRSPRAAGPSCCLLVNRLFLFAPLQRPRPLVQPGRGSWLRAPLGSLHPQQRILSWIQPHELGEHRKNLRWARVPCSAPCSWHRDAVRSRVMVGSPWFWPQRTSPCQGSASPPAGRAALGLPFPQGNAQDQPHVPSGVHGTAPLPLTPQAGAGMKQAAARAAQPRRWYVAAPVLGCR